MKPLTKTSFFALLATVSITAAMPAFAATDTDGDGVPDTAEPLIHADPMNADTDGDGMNDLKDDNPVFAATDPIATDGAATPFTVKEALVEDNYNYAAKKDATDHLELQVVNTTGQDLKNFSVYYTITDKDLGTKEAYFKALDSFSVPANGDARIHFDDSGLPGHFRANPNSIYLTSQNAKLFTVELKAEGFKPLTLEINKDAGGAEAAD
ncbi:hypothetical protein VK792_17540 [Mesobacterium sp. TK19101]|uniref:Uncharacterized protein n=1 Tax=Mesobacterium hydrothermale TaxID=3111907 RepID=A0ABU6HKW2_9RHOB|nr:hypothetical protein [Mesobacterium sp. TK19101]MEC3863099.1 hypothetical protein [Mesobacterium sp. TK19101]